MYDAFYKLTNSNTQISSYVFDVVRASVPKMNLVWHVIFLSFNLHSIVY